MILFRETNFNSIDVNDGVEELFKALYYNVVELLKEGRNVEALQLVKGACDVPLRVAKKYIDQVKEEIAPPPTKIVHGAVYKTTRHQTYANKGDLVVLKFLNEDGYSWYCNLTDGRGIDNGGVPLCDEDMIEVRSAECLLGDMNDSNRS